MPTCTGQVHKNEEEDKDKNERFVALQLRSSTVPPYLNKATSKAKATHLSPSSGMRKNGRSQTRFSRR